MRVVAGDKEQPDGLVFPHERNVHKGDAFRVAMSRECGAEGRIRRIPCMDGPPTVEHTAVYASRRRRQAMADVNGIGEDSVPCGVVELFSLLDAEPGVSAVTQPAGRSSNRLDDGLCVRGREGDPAKDICRCILLLKRLSQRGLGPGFALA